MNVDKTAVLIVGGGPVGMMMGLLLAKGGVRSVIVERRTGLHQVPQAHVISTRSMEICRTAGVDEAAMRSQATQPQDMAHIRWVATLAEPDLGAYALVRGPEAVAAMLQQSPTPICNLSQHLFEPILLDAVQQTGMIELRIGCEWTGFKYTDGGFLSRINPAEGTPMAVESRYLIGADGAGSKVRDALGIAMRGPERLAAYCNLFFSANLRSLLAERPVAQANCEQSARNFHKLDQVAQAMNLSADWEASRRTLSSVRQDDGRRAKVQAAIDKQAEHFNMSGLDLGVCYRSDAVINDGDPPAPSNPVSQYLPSTTPGARLPHAPVVRNGTPCSTLDLVPYDSFRLLHQAGDDSAAAAAASLAGQGLPVKAVAVGPGGDAQPMDATLDKALDLTNQPLLVRPDGHIAWRGSPNRRPQAELAAALGRILGSG